jgi:succinoglycan biosynthesis transport protein ExoP
VTSTLPGEGKTTVALNLALAHAQTARTLLIDCDMRRADVSRVVGLGEGAKGLTNLVAGTAKPSECIAVLNNANLSVLPVGDIPPNPLELLLSQRFKNTLKALTSHFEVIVIDSPPVEMVSEAMVLAPLATSSVVVVRAAHTPAPLVRKTLQRLTRAGGSILGVVVNALDFKHAQRYYGEYMAEGYPYGYGDGYSAYGTSGRRKRVAQGRRKGNGLDSSSGDDSTSGRDSTGGGDSTSGGDSTIGGDSTGIDSTAGVLDGRPNVYAESQAIDGAPRAGAGA